VGLRGSRDCFGLWRAGGFVGLWSFGFRGFERRRAGLEIWADVRTWWFERLWEFERGE
jgi:hypothetical protein